MKIPGRIVRRRLRGLETQIARFEDRLLKLAGELGTLVTVADEIDRQSALVAEGTCPAFDIQQLWTVAAPIVGQVEPLGMRDPDRIANPAKAAACLSAARAIVAGALDDRNRSVADLDNRRLLAFAAFGRVANAALAAGEISIGPEDLAISGDAEADGARFLADLREALAGRPGSRTGRESPSSMESNL